MTLACEEAFANLVDVVTVADFMLRNVLTVVCCRFGRGSFGHRNSEFEHKVWSRFQSLSSGEILKLNFGKYFAADAWLRL